MLAWSIVVPVGDDGGSDFGDAGAPAQQQQQQKQKVVKLMQRQKKLSLALSKIFEPPLYLTLPCLTLTSSMLKISPLSWKPLPRP